MPRLIGCGKKSSVRANNLDASAVRKSEPTKSKIKPTEPIFSTIKHEKAISGIGKLFKQPKLPFLPVRLYQPSRGQVREDPSE